jgi:hypothetical protein
MVNEGQRSDGLIYGDCIGLQLIYRDDSTGLLPLSCAGRIVRRVAVIAMWITAPSSASAQTDAGEYSESAAGSG